ncbi:DNA polymerase III subunit delta [Candidatus Parcubacteria bacterium]|nr:DNA polymerase III subunit delta [Candidatus Parcubacteria bacterium]
MIIFLYGEDTFRSKQKLNEFKDKFIQEIDPTNKNINFINGETCTIDKITNTTGTISLFSQKKMVIIENIFSNKSKTILDLTFDFFKSKEETDDIIVFIDDTTGTKLKKNKLFNFLDKLKFTQNFKYLNNTAIINFIKNTINKKSGKISNQAIIKLANLSGNDLWQINNNINILVNFKKNDEITEADIDKFVKGEATENIFALIDAICIKNKKLALELFENELEAGQAEGYLFYMINRQFKILLQIKLELEQNKTAKEITSKLKLHPFVVQKSSAQAKNFNLQKLKNILSYLIKLDSEIKTGKINTKTALELLIVKL